MKILSWLITLPIIVIAIVFAVSNRQAVTLNLWPLDMTVNAPLYIVTLGTFFTGLFLGAIGFWLSSLRHVWDKVFLRKEISKLKTELEGERTKHLPVP
jgi:uncharacterized integral membrane protein